MENCDDCCPFILYALLKEHLDCFLAFFEKLTKQSQKKYLCDVIQTGDVSFLKKVLEVFAISQLFGEDSCDDDKRKYIHASLSSEDMFRFLLEHGFSTVLYHTCEDHCRLTKIICNSETKYYSFGLILKDWEESMDLNIKEPAT